MGFSENVQIELNLGRCIRSYGQKNLKNRPICVAFHNMNDRKKVWDARGKLKNTLKYYICEDYVTDIQRRRCTIYKDHIAVKVDKLLCHGKKYTCKSLFSLPSPVNTRRTSELSTADTILF